MLASRLHVGAIPPFDNLYGLPTFVDNALCKNDDIIIGVGTESVHIKNQIPTYQRIVRPRIGSFAVKFDSPRSE